MTQKKRGKRTSASGRSRPGSQTQTRGKSSGNGKTQGQHMVESLADAFFAELADMMNAETQVLKALRKLTSSARSPRLRDALETHAEETGEQITRIERLFQMFDRKTHSETCEGIQGILSEGKELLETAGDDVRDALIIASAQKVEHYEIASYGTLCAWAQQAGEREAVRLLEASLREEMHADKVLSRIAESASNREAHDRPEPRGRQAESRAAS